MRDLFLIALGIGICSLALVALEWWSSRPRRVDFTRDYFRPCREWWRCRRCKTA